MLWPWVKQQLQPVRILRVVLAVLGNHGLQVCGEPTTPPICSNAVPETGGLDLSGDFFYNFHSIASSVQVNPAGIDLETLAGIDNKLLAVGLDKTIAFDGDPGSTDINDDGVLLAGFLHNGVGLGE